MTADILDFEAHRRAKRSAILAEIFSRLVDADDATLDRVRDELRALERRDDPRRAAR